MINKPHWFPSHIREVSRVECLDLLGSHGVGRVAYCDADGPVVYPVNYVMSGDQVLIGISPHSEMARHLRSGPASFQVDELDDYTESGWSVLVRGHAAFVPYDQLPEHDQLPVPWAEGRRTFYVRITPAVITGRRLLEA